MKKEDITEFTETILPVYELYDKDLSDGAIRIMFALLEPYSILEVKKALANHMREVKFPPKPADIIGQIEKVNHGGRLGSDEAWGLALKAMDENASVELNDEIAEAKNASDYIFREGDKVGARMAFKAAYDRIVADHRGKGIQVNWFKSLGFDVDSRSELTSPQDQNQITYNLDGSMIDAPETNFNKIASKEFEQ